MALSPAATAPESGPLQILQRQAWPSPWNGASPGYVSVKLAGSCDDLELKVYSNAMVCVGVRDAGPRPAGWTAILLPDAMENGVANGLYYYKVVARRGGSAVKAVGRMVVMR